MANDIDGDGDALTVTQVNGSGANVGSLFTLPSGANLTVGTLGDFIYDPNGAFDYLAAGQVATDSFTYQVDDGNGGTDTATVTLRITGTADAPTSNNVGATGDEDDTSIAITLTGSDVDGSVDFYQLTSLPANGTLYTDATLLIRCRDRQRLRCHGRSADTLFRAESRLERGHQLPVCS